MALSDIRDSDVRELCELLIGAEFYSVPNSLLLRLYLDVLDAFYDRDILRTGDGGNVVGGYAEYLVAKALGLRRTPRKTPGCDAIDPRTKERYEVKGRTTWGVRSLRIDAGTFHYLVGVEFTESLTVN